jgi:acyl carrier protein
MTPDIPGKVTEILRVVLDLPADRDIETVRKITTPSWDSLAQASIIAAIESEFGIEFDPADYDRITSYESACLLVEEKLH